MSDALRAEISRLRDKCADYEAEIARWRRAAEGDAVEFPVGLRLTPQERVILRALVTHGRVSRERLALILWSETLDALRIKHIDSVVFTLRRKLAGIATIHGVFLFGFEIDEAGRRRLRAGAARPWAGARGGARLRVVQGGLEPADQPACAPRDEPDARRRA